jgi:hypothetical protein
MEYGVRSTLCQYQLDNERDQSKILAFFFFFFSRMISTFHLLSTLKFFCFCLACAFTKLVPCRLSTFNYTLTQWQLQRWWKSTLELLLIDMLNQIGLKERTLLSYTKNTSKMGWLGCWWFWWNNVEKLEKKMIKGREWDREKGKGKKKGAYIIMSNQLKEFSVIWRQESTASWDVSFLKKQIKIITCSFFRINNHLRWVVTSQKLYSIDLKL